MTPLMDVNAVTENFEQIVETKGKKKRQCKRGRRDDDVLFGRYFVVMD